MFKKVLFSIAAALLLAGCTSLQEDIFDSSDASSEILNSISDYENKYIQLHGDFLQNGKFTVESPAELHLTLENQISHAHEPAVIARLEAMDGLIYLMEGKNNKAQNFLKEAKDAQPTDSYVLLLQGRLSKTKDEELAHLEEKLATDKNNKLLLLEKGIVLYELKQYDKSIAAIDVALLAADEEGNTMYRECYSPFRETIWKLYSADLDNNSSANNSNINLAANLTKEAMISITKTNTTLLDDLTTGTKLNNNELIKKVTAYGLLSSALDESNENNSASLILSSNAITRVMAARFIWNLYVQQKGNPNLKTRYSTRYKKMANPLSPIEDIEVTNEDFDAVLGVVEKEFMDLPDGKNFYPDEILTGIDYLTILKKSQ